MFGNIVILLISVFVIGLNIYVLTYKKNASVTAKLISILLFVVWILSVVSPNIPILKSPFTSAMKGRVIDAETKKPLSNTNVKIGWKVAYAAIGEGSITIYKTFSTVTNQEGAFIVPKTLKPLSIWALPLFLRLYDGIGIIAYSSDYKFAIIDLNKKTKLNDIPMTALKNDKAYLENINGLSGYLSAYSNYKKLELEDEKFIINAYHLFEKKFPHSTLGEESLFVLSGFLNWLGDHEADVKVLRELIVKYPNGVHAEYAKQEIELLIKKYNLKIDKNF